MRASWLVSLLQLLVVVVWAPWVVARAEEVGPLAFDYMLDPETSLRSNYPRLFREVLRRQGRSRGVVVEIGVAQGVNAQDALDQQSGAIETFHLVDPFLTPQLAARLERWPADFPQTRLEFYRETSMEAVGRVPDGSVDWVYIDGLHTYDSVKADIRAWWPKLRDGGLFSGHDYCGAMKDIRGVDSHAPWCGRYMANSTRHAPLSEKDSQIGSFRAVNEFARDYNVQVLYTLEGRHAGSRHGDNNPSWWTVKYAGAGPQGSRGPRSEGQARAARPHPHAGPPRRRPGGRGQ